LKILNIERILSTTDLNIDLAEIKTTTGNIIERFIIDPLRNAVVGVACYKGQLILIKTKRFLWDKKTWELPGGWIKDGEIALSAIRRKVEEETGYEVSDIKRLGNTFSDIGMTKKEKFYFFVDVTQKKFHHNEDIVDKVGLFSIQQVKKLIHKGEIIDDRTIAGVMLAESKGFLK